jgi:aminopeptidase N
MIDANNRPDLHAMEDWYKTPGTPVVRLHNVKYNEKKKTFQFTLTQKSPSTPLLIPIRVGLIGRSSKLDTIPEKVHVFI